MLLRRQCEICGAKSKAVGADPSPAELRMVVEFEEEHSRCAEGVVGWDRRDTVSTRPDGWRPPQGGAFGSKKAPPRSVPKPHGHVEYTGPYGERQEADTISCCHCRKHVEVRTGALGRGGFCGLCYNGKAGSGWTCGMPDCADHVPYEVRLDNADAGRPWLTPKAPQASVPAGFAGAVLLAPAAPAATPVDFTLTADATLEAPRGPVEA